MHNANWDDAAKSAVSNPSGQRNGLGQSAPVKLSPSKKTRRSTALHFSRHHYSSSICSHHPSQLLQHFHKSFKLWLRASI
jgi:hypothetical protein